MNCDGEMIHYNTPVDCCFEGNFVPCPAKKCKMSEKPRNSAFIHFNTYTQETKIYPKGNITVGAVPLPSDEIYKVQTWHYNGGFLED